LYYALTANVGNMLTTTKIFRDHSPHTIGAGKRAKMTTATLSRCISLASTWEMVGGESAPNRTRIVGNLNRFHSRKQRGNNCVIFSYCIYIIYILYYISIRYSIIRKSLVVLNIIIQINIFLFDF